MDRGFTQSTCVKHFSIIHGLNFFFCSGFICQLKWVGNFVDLLAGVSSSPDSIWIALLLPTLSFTWTSLIFLSFFFSFTFSASSNVITITIRALGIVFTFVN